MEPREISRYKKFKLNPRINNRLNYPRKSAILPLAPIETPHTSETIIVISQQCDTTHHKLKNLLFFKTFFIPNNLDIQSLL